MKKTEAFILFYNNENHYDLLQYMKIKSSSRTYPMKIEYLLQLLLQKFCEESKTKENDDYKFFENEANTGRILTVEVSDELYKHDDVVKALKSLESRFNEWITCIMILYELDLMKTKSIFPLFCRGFSDIIQLLIEPDLVSSSTTPDRVKVSAKPKYSLPTETLYVRAL